MNNINNFIKVGQISAAHGLIGQFIIRSFTAPIAQIFTYKNLYNAKFVTFTVKKQGVKISKGRELFICSSPEFKSRNDVDLVIKSYIYTTRLDFAEPNNDEFYQIDLIDCDVLLHATGELIAKVISVQNYGAGDIIEIKFLKNADDDNSSKENIIMLPFNAHYVNNVDLPNKRIYVTLPIYT